MILIIRLGGNLEIKLIESAASAWAWLQTNSGGLEVVLAVVIPIISGVVILLRGRSKKRAPVAMPTGMGGTGGNASVNGNGIALGGRGGMSGTGGAGGGHGGSAHVEGDGMAIGGDGGDAGVFWRPALGAPSPISRSPQISGMMNDMRDEFGFFVPGRGGHSGDLQTTVKVQGRAIPLIPLLEFLRIWAPEVIRQADAARPASPQDFWDTVIGIDPAAAHDAVAHTLHCIDITIPRGLSPPDPYKR